MEMDTDFMARMPMGRVAQIGLLALVLVVVLFIVLWNPGADEEKAAEEAAKKTEQAEKKASEGAVMLTTTPREGSRVRAKQPAAREVAGDNPSTSKRTKPKKTEAAKKKPAAKTVAKKLPKKPPAGPMRYHVVTDEDTLRRIAARYYGDANAYPIIAKANGLADPNKVPLGRKLKIPPRGMSAATPRTARRDATLPGGAKYHEVEPGDNYIRIAKRYYGDKNAWRKIAAANNVPPEKLRVGMRIVIPE